MLALERRGSADRFGAVLRTFKNGRSRFVVLDFYDFVVRKSCAFVVQEVQKVANVFRSKLQVEVIHTNGNRFSSIGGQTGNEFNAIL